MEAEAAEVMRAVAAELGLGEAPPMPGLRTRLEVFYSAQISDPSSLYGTLVTNAAYAGIYHPMSEIPGGGGWLPKFSSRLLSEDVPFALVPIRGAAEVLGIKTPCIDKVRRPGEGTRAQE